MYQNPKRAKKLYKEIVPKAVDEYLECIEKSKKQNDVIYMGIICTKLQKKKSCVTEFPKIRDAIFGNQKKHIYKRII